MFNLDLDRVCLEKYCDSSGGCAVTFSDEKTCNHVFCRSCITAWLSKEHVNTCAVCRRVLFDLDDSSSIDGDYYDDEDNDEEEGEEEEEGYEGDYEDDEPNPPLDSESEMEDENLLQLRIPTADRNHILPGEIIHDVLVSLWYKMWWLLGGYRCYVFDVHNGSRRPSVGYSREGISSDQGMYRLPNRLCFVHTFLSTVFVMGINFTYLPNDAASEMLNWLLQDIAVSIKAHIDITNGSDDVPSFPWWKQRIWGEPLQWLLAAPEESWSRHDSREGARER